MSTNNSTNTVENDKDSENNTRVTIDNNDNPDNYNKLKDISNEKSNKRSITQETKLDESLEQRPLKVILKERLNNFQHFISHLPLFTNIVCIVSIILYILSKLLSFILYLQNIPDKTLHQYRVWAIFTGTFISSGLINLVVCLMFWTHKARNLEKSLSTIRYMINFLIDSVITNFVYFIAGLVFGFSDWPYNGLLAVTMCQNTLLCIANPKVKLSLIFCDLEAKYYPAVLSFVMFIAHFGRAADILVGVVYAFAYYYLIRIQISDELAARLEEMFSFLAKFKSFVPVSDASGGESRNNANSSSVSSGKEEKGSEGNANKLKENKHEISVEKLDKSSDRGNSYTLNKGGSNKQVNYINLEDEKNM